MSNNEELAKVNSPTQHMLHRDFLCYRTRRGPTHRPGFVVLTFAHSNPRQVKSLVSHRLIEPTFHLEEKICKKHERLMDVYCRTDHTCICTACVETSHKSHDIVSVDHEWKKKMVSWRQKTDVSCEILGIKIDFN